MVEGSVGMDVKMDGAGESQHNRLPGLLCYSVGDPRGPFSPRWGRPYAHSLNHYGYAAAPLE